MNQPPAEIAAWLACLVFVIALYNQLAKAKANFNGTAKRTEVSNSPLEVRESHEFATEKDCLLRAAALEKAIEILRSERIQDMKDAAHSRKSLYAQIDQVRKELSDKIDCMPDRVIATLKNFGAIGHSNN
jgi:hypothetical protein